jgi:signal transduction histidine kinase
MAAEPQPTDVRVPLEHEREVLRQAGIALGRRVVTLWEISPTASAVPLLSGVPDPRPEDVRLDLEKTLLRWGAPIVHKSRWVGCRLAADGPWVVAPVRSRPAAPPPAGIERRSRERLVLELAGLSLGAIAAAAEGAQRRLSPAEALWELARQPSVIAHEVGNPLAVALGNLDLGVDTIRSAAALDPALRAELLEDLSHVAEGIEQAADYLRSIQDRPFGGVGRQARFDVTPVVRSCVTLERPLARKYGVALQWESSVDSLYLYGDSAALYQVVTNLVRNAVYASRERRAPVVVALDRGGSGGDCLHLAVRDTGDGIAPEHLGRVFERGFTTKPPGEGTGLGLAVVKEITESMFGGTVRVESKRGRGSTFLLTLPIPPQRSTEGGSG